MPPKTPRQTEDWKDKYFTALEDQEKREKKLNQLMALLTRAVQQISLIADGVDQQLDKQLAGLRKLLREGSPSGRDLNTVVSALDGQVKRLDDVKAQRAKAIAESLQTSVAQLQRLKPEKPASAQLKKLNQSIKSRSGRIQEYAGLIKEYSAIQKAVLEDSGDLKISKPFWHVWLDGPVKAKQPTIDVVEETEQETNSIVETVEEKPADQNPGGEEKPNLAKRSLEDREAPDSNNDGLDLADNVDQPREAVDPDKLGKEPPFSRLNQAVCDILSELLDQIEPPPMARDNYKTARKQVEKGLNWYELIPTLEDVSIVVVSAFDSYQKDFESFLNQLNDRLAEAADGLQLSMKSQNAGIDANRKLRESMRAEVSAMQQSVEQATEIDQLKTEVSDRLDHIVAAMDKHQVEEQQREATLSEQLDALVERVKNMETASATAEQRIEEQRQKALRDVLTQLPNREAYEQRLEQEFERWQRYQRPLSMVVCDIDFFKKINDNYGHQAGDKVLRIIAKTLSKRLRKTDFVARYGGEEFVILMPETEHERAFKVVEGVREAIAQCPFHFKEKPVSITMSFGVTAFRDDDQHEQVFARADKALYQAKEQGRNQTVKT